MNDSDKESLIGNLLKLLPSYNHCFHNFSYIRSLDLTKTQLKVLIILKQHGDMSMSKLADLLSTSREQTTRAVSPLADRDYIIRLTNEKNRRILNVAITQSGLDFLQNLRKNYAVQLLESIEMLSEKEINDFIKSLNIILNTLEKIAVKME